MTIVRETHANELKTKRDWKALKLALKFADKIVFLSDEYNGQVKKRFPGLYRSSKIAVIPNGIDLELYRPAEKTNTNPIVLGMQGRIVIIKDHDTLLEAFAMLKQQLPQLELQLKIAGDGEYKNVLKKKAIQLGIAASVEFTGTLDENELVAFIRSLDIYVHASLGETMSTAIMQAMACKKTIVASDVPGINNMIIHKNTGWLVPVKDAAAMASVITQLINDKELASGLAAKAYRFALDHYSNAKMFNRYKELFNS
jgi:glycosyltransferase involved in cell wall biosynthesis